MAEEDDRDGPEERRTDPREIAVLRVAKLVTDRGEQLCRIRNISAGGVMLEAPGFYLRGEHAAIELKSGGTAGGRIAWVDEGRLGIAFDEPVDPDSILAVDPDQPPRALRFVVAVEASLCVGRVFRRVAVEDISLGGIRVRLEEPIAVEVKVLVTIDGLPNLAGRLRWRSGGYAGIAFDEALALDTLAFWLAERR